jgi:hypothetical protein
MKYLCMIFFVGVSSAQTYYIAPTGSDGGTGAIGDPFATFEKAETVLYAGDTLLVRGGIYTQRINMGTRDGTSGSPIVIANYPGESPIIDGDTVTVPEGYGLVDMNCAYLYISGLEVMNSSQNGVRLTDQYCKVSNLLVHDITGTGIGGYRDYSIIEDCVGYNLAMANENHVMEGEDGAPLPGQYWGAGFAIGRSTVAGGTDTVDYAIIRRCVVHDCWGEGISSFEAKHSTIEDNTIYDVYSNMLYLSDTEDGLVQRNLIYTTKPMFAVHKAQQIGIAISDEVEHPQGDRDTVINNMVFNCYINLYLSGYVYTNMLIANNTFVNSLDLAGIQVTGDASSYTNCSFVNNLTVQDGVLPVIYFNAPTLQTLIFSHNLWSKAPHDSAVGDGDVVADPLLMKTGDTTAGDLTVSYFSLQSSSPAIDVGEDVGLSYVGIAPDMGAREYTTPTTYFSKRLGKRN